MIGLTKSVIPKYATSNMTVMIQNGIPEFGGARPPLDPRIAGWCRSQNAKRPQAEMGQQMPAGLAPWRSRLSRPFFKGSANMLG